LDCVGFALGKSLPAARYRELKKLHGKVFMYINLITQLKNAQAVKKESAKVVYSKRDEEVLEVLKRGGYIENFEKKGRGAKRILDVQLKYHDGRGVISGIKFISKPSRRFYTGYKEIKPSKSGYGIFVLSTPRGILTGREAKKIKVGGEMLFEIW